MSPGFSFPPAILCVSVTHKIDHVASVTNTLRVVIGWFDLRDLEDDDDDDYDDDGDDDDDDDAYILHKCRC